MERIIGIDFGTSTTYMNVKRYNGAQPDGDKFSYIPVMFNYGESSGYVATIVRENADGSFDFGEKASEQLEGAKIHTEIKMRLESPDEQERAAARRITREFFKFLHEQYAQQAANLGGTDDKEETVVSYPVKWQKETAQFMLDAARDAGFQNVRGMDEAEAAVATVLCQNSGNKGLIYADKPGYLMLIDMGAGTTDLVVCRYEARTNGEIAIELVASWPHSADEPTFGGREIDAVLEQYVANYLTESLLNQSLLPIAQDFATKPGESKKWKERHVSVNLADGKPVITCGYVSPLRSMLSTDFPAFDRAGFEVLIESGLRDYARLISGCLEKTAEVDKNFSVLDLVILTGGHSAWYFAREILNGAMEGWVDHPALATVREIPYCVVNLPNPQTTVSLGLVYSNLPFGLEKKQVPVEKAEQDLRQSLVDVLNNESSRQKTEKQPSAEGKKPADTAEDAETFYFREGRKFLAGKTCDPQTIRYARTRLNIPSGEEVLWAEGIVKSSYDPGTYAIAESGIYLLEIFSGRHRLSWAEFVAAEWADRSFVAPGRRNENRWDTSVPLVIKYEKGPLKELHAYLRVRGLAAPKISGITRGPKQDNHQRSTDVPIPENFLQMTPDQIIPEFFGNGSPQKSDEKPASGQYKWDDRLLSIVKQVIQSAPDIKKTNKIQDTDLVNLMRSNFGLPPSEEIFYVYDFDYNDKSVRYGCILSARGIYRRMPRMFSKSPKEESMLWGAFLNSKEEGNQLYSDYSYGGDKVFFSDHDIKTGMYKLYLLLRKKSVSLQDGSYPLKQESADGKWYEWDDKLLSIVEEFVQQDPILRSRNKLHQYDEKKLISKIELRGNPTLYYVTESFYKFGGYFLISSNGIGDVCHVSYILGYGYGGMVSWSDFLNMNSEDPFCDFWKDLQSNREGHHLVDSLLKLQRLLREKSIALEDYI